MEKRDFLCWPGQVERNQGWMHPPATGGTTLENNRARITVIKRDSQASSASKGGLQVHLEPIQVCGKKHLLPSQRIRNRATNDFLPQGSSRIIFVLLFLAPPKGIFHAGMCRFKVFFKIENSRRHKLALY